jgi:HTH-type transcriptional regulator/antitoxin HipB
MRDQAFAQNFETGYTEFKIDVILRQAREEAGLTQEEAAQRLHTKKSAMFQCKSGFGKFSDEY